MSASFSENNFLPNRGTSMSSKQSRSVYAHPFFSRTRGSPVPVIEIIASRGCAFQFLAEWIEIAETSLMVMVGFIGYLRRPAAILNASSPGSMPFAFSIAKDFWNARFAQCSMSDGCASPSW